MDNSYKLGQEGKVDLRDMHMLVANCKNLVVSCEMSELLASHSYPANLRSRVKLSFLSTSGGS